MGHTNSTPNIGLPQFIGTDKPTWLGDVNGAMSTIDTKVGSIDAAVATVDAKADNAVADAAGAVTTATNAVTTAGNASTTATQANNLATQALTVANNTADLCTNQIVPDVQANKTAIGTLADLQTTAKDNLVNAINEVAQGGGGGTTAWTKVGSATGTTPISIPDDASEIYLVCTKGTDNMRNAMFILTAELTSNSNVYTCAGSGNSETSSWTYSVDNTSVAIQHVRSGSTEVTSTSTLTLYAR